VRRGAISRKCSWRSWTTHRTKNRTGEICCTLVCCGRMLIGRASSSPLPHFWHGHQAERSQYFFCTAVMKSLPVLNQELPNSMFYQSRPIAMRLEGFHNWVSAKWADLLYVEESIDCRASVKIVQIFVSVRSRALILGCTIYRDLWTQTDIGAMVFDSFIGSFRTSVALNLKSELKMK